MTLASKNFIAKRASKVQNSSLHFRANAGKKGLIPCGSAAPHLNSPAGGLGARALPWDLMPFILTVIGLALSVSFVFAHGPEQEAITAGPTGVLPDSPIFVLDRFFEKVGDVFAFSASSKLERQMDHAQERLTELFALITRGRTRFIPKTLELYEKHIARAAELLARVDGDNGILVGQLVTSLFTQREVLAGIYNDLADDNRPIAKKALDRAGAITTDVLAHASETQRNALNEVRELYDAEVNLLIAKPIEVVAPPVQVPVAPDI